MRKGSRARRDPEFNFVTLFDPDTGGYLRTGILDDDGRDTGIDPLMASFPHLLDVGIMGHCDHGLSGKCQEAGVQCYQSGGLRYSPNMTLEDFKSLVDQCAGKTHQFALGGRGDPEVHEDFREILEYCREHDIVPNLTTSGYGLDERRALLIKQYCGAAAVSWYGTPYTARAIEMLVGLGVKTNIHFVLSSESIDAAIALLEGTGLPRGINRLIFLLFKPVGQGRHERVLRAGDPRVRRLFSLISRPEIAGVVGFDSCCVPAVVNHAPGIDPRSFDTCEGARFSAYVTPDLKMTPCSFDQDLRFARDLKKESIAQAWRSPEFASFRNLLDGSCPGCVDREACMGGCPLIPEIVLCSRAVRASGALKEVRSSEIQD